MAEKTSDSISLTWDAPPYESQNGIISQYVIRILENDTGITTLFYSNTTTMTVNDLHPYYVYKCSVAAETIDIGPYTAVLTLQLDEDCKSLTHISQYGSTVYIGIAMVFVFFPYIRKFSFCLHFHINTRISNESALQSINHVPNIS